MPNNLFQIIVERLQGWANLVMALFDEDQLIMLALIFGLTLALQPTLHRLLERLRPRLGTISWLAKLLRISERLLLPLTIRLLTQLGTEIFRSVEMEVALLELAGRLLSLWLAYRLLTTFFEVNFPPSQANFWNRKVVLPAILGIALLTIFGLLDAVLAWGFSLGQRELRITVGSLFVGLATLILFFILSRGVRQFLKQVFLPQAGAEPALTQAISTLVSYVVILMGTMVALSAMGVDLTAFTVILGGLSVGLGFGLQEIINNFISGFIILFERSLGPGDVVRINDDVGEVKDVGIRSTTIKTRDEIELIVPNSYFLTEIVTNLTRTERHVRVRVPVGVSYSANPRQVEEALLEAVSDHPNVLPTPHPRVQFAAFGDSSLNFDLLIWTDQTHRIPGFSSELRYRIWDSLAARNIEIPFPQRDIHLRTGIPWEALLQTAKVES